MSIEEGYQAVRSAMGAGRVIGNCERCKKILVFDPAGGNCQPYCTFHVGLKHKPEHVTIFNGAAGFMTDWEGQLCDQCVFDLKRFLGNGSVWFQEPR